jgi:hypothetical protein
MGEVSEFVGEIRLYSKKDRIVRNIGMDEEYAPGIHLRDTCVYGGISAHFPASRCAWLLAQYRLWSLYL